MATMRLGQSILDLLKERTMIEGTNIPHVYHDTENWIFPYFYIKGLYYFDLNPWALKSLGVETKNDYSSLTFPEGIKEADFAEVLQKQEARHRQILESERGYVKVFERIEKRVGIGLYIDYFDEIPDDQKYDAFIGIYTRANAGFELFEDIYHEIFEFASLSHDRTHRLKRLAKKVGKRFTIYHGEKLPESSWQPRDLYSWTLSKEKAEWFAKRFNEHGEVWEREIDFSEALDYIMDAGEEEVLYNYEA